MKQASTLYRPGGATIAVERVNRRPVLEDMMQDALHLVAGEKAHAAAHGAADAVLEQLSRATHPTLLPAAHRALKAKLEILITGNRRAGRKPPRSARAKADEHFNLGPKP